MTSGSLNSLCWPRTKKMRKQRASHRVQATNWTKKKPCIKVSFALHIWPRSSARSSFRVHGCSTVVGYFPWKEKILHLVQLMPMLMFPAVTNKRAKKLDEWIISQLRCRLQSALGVLAHLRKCEANHSGLTKKIIYA